MQIERRKFLGKSAKILGFSTAFSILNKCGSAVKKPNILFINTDDQAQWAVGAYGNDDIHTPNMDRLAKEGMLFKYAFTTPVCSPSRAMVMAGCYSHQVGIDDWISSKETIGFPPNRKSIADMLRENGYITGLIGKWHLGKEEEYHPKRHGFDYFMGFLEGGNNPLNPTLEVNDKKQELEGYLTDILGEDAVKFIRTYSNSDKPFALFFHTRAPHKPYMPVPDEDMAHYKDKKFKVPDIRSYSEIKDFTEEHLQKMYCEYYASITSVDRNIGYLLEELENLAIEDNTIVIFTGDNGYNLGRHGLETKGNAIFLGTKTRRPNMFDSSVLVPLIIRYPSVVKPATICEEMVSSIDYFPTFMEIAGAKQTKELKLEGISMMPLLKGEKPDNWHNAVFDGYDMHHGATANMRMIRTKDWKLILHFEESSKNELYDLKNDPGELKNLYDNESYSNIQKQLESRLKEWISRTGTNKRL